MWRVHGATETGISTQINIYKFSKLTTVHIAISANEITSLDDCNCNTKERLFNLFAESTFATLPKTQRATSMVMGASPDGKRFVYCNGNSVVMRDVEVNLQFDKKIYPSRNFAKK